MRMRSGLIVGCFSLAVLGGACDDGGAPSSLSEAYKEGIRANCEKAHSCKASYDPSMHNNEAFESTYGADANACYNQLITLISTFLGADYFMKLDASQDAGRIEYVPADFEICLDSIGAATCDQFFEQNNAMAPNTPQCQTAIQGTVASGGTCTIDEDCAGAAECNTSNVCM